VQNKNARKLVTTGSPKHSGIPCAVVLTVSFVRSPETGLSCHHRQRDAKHHRQLDISVEMSTARFPKFVRHSRPLFRELRKAKGSSGF
jgi:hypothetical protein